MRVIAPVEWSRRIGEHLVVGDVVLVDVVASRSPNDWGADAEIADERGHRDVHDIVSKATAIRPAARNGSAAESRLDLARQHVPAEDAQTREPSVVWIVRVTSSPAGQTRRC